MFMESTVQLYVCCMHLTEQREKVHRVHRQRQRDDNNDAKGVAGKTGRSGALIECCVLTNQNRTTDL